MLWRESEGPQQAATQAVQLEDSQKAEATRCLLHCSQNVCRPDWKLPKTFNRARFPTKGRFGIGTVASRGWITSSMSNQTSWRGCTAAQEPKQATGRVPELEGASQRSLMALVYRNNIIKSHKIPKWQQPRQHKQCKTPRTKKKKRWQWLSIFTSSKKSDLCTKKKSDIIPGPIWSFQTRTRPIAVPHNATWEPTEVC